MKKVLVAFVVLLTVNFACKKSFVEPVCGCSPVSYPSFGLSIKNAQGDDLLNPKTSGSFSKEQVQIFQKDANGTTKQILFQIAPPTNQPDLKFSNHLIFMNDIIYLLKDEKLTFYLKLADQQPVELKFQTNAQNKIEKMFVDNKEVVRETVGVEKFPTPIFNWVR